jgi:hypothetical protein
VDLPCGVLVVGNEPTPAAHASLCPPTPRLNELQVVKGRLSEAEADRARAHRDLEEVNTKVAWLQRINSQVRLGAIHVVTLCLPGSPGACCV